MGSKNEEIAEQSHSMTAWEEHKMDHGKRLWTQSIKYKHSNEVFRTLSGMCQAAFHKLLDVAE